LTDKTKTKTTTRKKQAILQSLKTTDAIVKAYFSLISEKHLDSLLELFDNDAVVYEPFSSESDGLRGKEMIKHFLKVVFMANTGLQREIEFEKLTDNEAIALITFERGGSVKARFSFKLVTEENENNSSKIATTTAAATAGQKRIKELRIRFL
jgi:hypothetical protein